jgi:hypothetical protein
VLEQLDDEHINWRPNSYSNSISNLVMHINGYIKERIEKGILHRAISRSREEELGAITVPNKELQQLIKERFDFVISIIECITEVQLEATQVVRVYLSTENPATQAFNNQPPKCINIQRDVYDLTSRLDMEPLWV